MANAENLEKAYAAIGALLTKGISKPSVEQVAGASGLARQTFYQKDMEWIEVRAVIKGKPSPRLKLVQVDIKHQSESARKIDELLSRVESMEQEVSRIEGIAGTVYEEMIDEIQHWFHKAAESPQRKTKAAQYLEELNNKIKELERLAAENRLLKAERERFSPVRVQTQKRTIELPALAKPGDSFTEFLRQIKPLVPMLNSDHSVSEVYILCGLPRSGKTTWIMRHQPESSGFHIYIDSCAQKEDTRRFFVDQIRSFSNAKIHCVWVRTDQDECFDRCELAFGGAKKELKLEEINTVAKSFDIPSFEENFDSVILVRGNA